jgi:tripeptide aminopeptidase
MVNKERIIETFLSFVHTDSHSRDERRMADLVRRYCEELGASVEEDAAGAAVGGNAGNIIARLPGSVAGRPFMLSAHMDTVTPGEGIKATVEDGRVRTDGTTILGGDDKTGLTVIIETMRLLQEEKIPHTGIEAVISICEEVGCSARKRLTRRASKRVKGLSSTPKARPSCTRKVLRRAASNLRFTDLRRTRELRPNRGFRRL